MWPNKKQLKEVFPGIGELSRLCSALWPEEWRTVRIGQELRLWLNAKTGVEVPSDAPARFDYWLPRLREIAYERGNNTN